MASWCNRTWQKQNLGAGGLVIGQGSVLSVGLCRRAKRHHWVGTGGGWQQACLYKGHCVMSCRC